MHDLIQGLGIVFSWPGFLYMLIGTFAGMFLGVFPGLSGIFVLAMLIPFIYGMPASEAFPFLLGAHTVTFTTGAITGILFNTPACGPTATTVFDGFPMTQMGKASQALSAAMVSSLFGGVLGAIFLALAIPIMAKVVLAFGPPEFFMMALLGVVFIAAVGRESLIESLVAGAFGLLLSMVGFEPVTGTVRYDFGLLYLQDGINLVPVIIGLFAIAQVIELATSKKGLLQSGTTVITKGAWEGIVETLRHWWLVVRCSVLGTVIGAVPGLGADTATFIAYGYAKQVSKNPEKFGRGAIEGLIAPLSAIHAKEAGGLIPTVTFGLPGGAAMAILLSAFYIAGLVPGPEMLSSHKPLLYSMVWTIIIANIIASLVVLLMANKMALITEIRGNILVPLILSLAILGTFSIKRQMSDVILSLLFGLIGYAMKKYNYSRAVLIIGLVLGKIMEVNLNLSLQLYGETMLRRPLTVVILLIIIISIIYGAIQRQRMKKLEMEETA